MPGKKKATHRITTAASAVHRSTVRSAIQDVIPVVARKQLDAVTTDKAQLLSGHKGNVLLEDVKPGQRVFLNATFMMGQPFLFEPDAMELQERVNTFTSYDLQFEKGNLHALAIKYERELRDIKPVQLHHKSAKLGDVAEIIATCEGLAILRHVLYDEPIPLIDIATVKEYDPSKDGECSSTKARKIGQAATSIPTTAGTTSSDSKATDEVKTPQSIEDMIPCIMLQGREKVYCACFSDKLADPERIVVRLRDILNVEGLLATSEKHLLRAADSYKERLESEKSALLQAYREAFQECYQFIKQDGNSRAREAWLQFITNCVHMYALRHVLHGKPLPCENPELDQELEIMLQTILPIHNSSDGPSSIAPTNTSTAGSSNEEPQGAGGLTFDQMCKMEWLTVFTGDCSGIPAGAITNGTTMAIMREKAEKLCRQDPSAAKKYFNELTKTCKKSVEDYNQLVDKAQIGIPQAVKEFQSWSQDCLYWLVLRRVLHNIPFASRPGRCGMSVDGGVELIPTADGDSLIMYGSQKMS